MLGMHRLCRADSWPAFLYSFFAIRLGWHARNTATGGAVSAARSVSEGKPLPDAFDLVGPPCAMLVALDKLEMA